MSLKERIEREIDKLPEAELQQIAEYLAFLKYRARRARPGRDDASLSALYAEFAEEDRELAEAGMGDYARSLAIEDTL